MHRPGRPSSIYLIVCDLVVWVVITISWTMSAIINIHYVKISSVSQVSANYNPWWNRRTGCVGNPRQSTRWVCSENINLFRINWAHVFAFVAGKKYPCGRVIYSWNKCIGSAETWNVYFKTFSIHLYRQTTRCIRWPPTETGISGWPKSFDHESWCRHQNLTGTQPKNTLACSVVVVDIATGRHRQTFHDTLRKARWTEIFVLVIVLSHT